MAVKIMKTLNTFETKLVTGAKCTKTSTVTVARGSTWKGFPQDGLYLMGSRVEDIHNQLIFQGTSGQFVYNDIEFQMAESMYNDVPSTTYTFKKKC